MRRLTGSFALALGMLLATSLRAEDQPFLTLYTPEVIDRGEAEFEQSYGWANGKHGQTFNAQSLRSELEYGITDNLQLSFYASYGWERSIAHPLMTPADSQHEFSVSGEANWRLASAENDGFGLGLYLEPRLGENSRGIEGKLLLQKNLLKDQLRFAANINLENEWTREAGKWNEESAIEFFAGAAYRITGPWSAGVEFNNENDYEGLIGSGQSAFHTFYFGPTLEYHGDPISIVVGAQFQLPWASDSTGMAGALHDGYASDAERLRFGIRLSTDL